MVRRVVDLPFPATETLRAEVTNGLAGSRERHIVYDHVAAVAEPRMIPGGPPRRLLEQRPVVLSTSHDDVRDVIVSDAVQLENAEVADNRAPNAGAPGQHRRAEETAVSAENEVPVRVDLHFAGVDVRRSKLPPEISVSWLPGALEASMRVR